ncbi:hypothetical protein [Parasedimentitalea denitrificans]|nr:hypothetical protein [Sedimentitalea sp. CY04]
MRILLYSQTLGYPADHAMKNTLVERVLHGGKLWDLADVAFNEVTQN